MAVPEEPPDGRVQCRVLRAVQGKVGAHLLELLDGTSVDATALVDQVCIPSSAVVPRIRSRRGRLTSGGRGLAGIDVADNDHVDVHLFFTVDMSAMIL